MIQQYLGGFMNSQIVKATDNIFRKFILIREAIALSYQSSSLFHFKERVRTSDNDHNERGDVPGWVLVVLMTTGLVTAIWTIAAPRLSTILKNSLDAMNGIR
jgi:hypothetical protein